MSYERDMSDDEKIINRLECLTDKLQEILDILQMIVANQNPKVTEVKSDYPSGISKEHHLHIQQEGLRKAAEDLLKHTRGNNQFGVNEAMYCALIRLIQIVDNLGKRFFNA